jgi:hypothetical protein
MITKKILKKDYLKDNIEYIKKFNKYIKTGH